MFLGRIIRNSDSEESEDADEMLSEENWGGLVVPKKRKRRSYLQKTQSGFT